jgi:hypothetical protein
MALASIAAGGMATRAATLDVAYDISLIGLPIGSANLTGTVDAQRFKLDIQARLSGLAGAVTGGRGAGSASGTVAGGQPVNSSFAVTAANSSEQRTVRMVIERRAVSAAEVMPPVEAKTDRIPLMDEHKKGVIDPISALLMPIQASDPRTACNRRIPVFDGAARYDIALFYAGSKDVKAEGYAGPAVVCAVRYTPVAGHRPRRAVKYMAENKDMQVWLTPINGTSLMLPFRISVKTLIGTAVIAASKYAIEPGGAGGR